MSTGLGDAELERYGRHVILEEIGVTGQEKIGKANMLVIGAGGLGCPTSIYLASAGVGSITIADDDIVEASNLQRQILFREDDIGNPKAEVAKRELSRINGMVHVEAKNFRANETNLEDLCVNKHIVLDCSDNFQTRHAVNIACQKSRVDLVSGSAEQFDGQVFVLPFSEAKSPCYNCVFPASESTPDPTPCSLLGVYAPLTGIIGAILASEALRLVAGISGAGLKWRMFAYDVLGQRTLNMKIKKMTGCKVCHNNM